MASVSAQPNVPGRGIVASYSPRFWLLVVLIGAAAGLGGAALIELLRAVQRVAWAYNTGHFLEGVERSSDPRRVLVLTLGGVVAGLSALVLARLGPGGEVTEGLWLRAGRLRLLPSVARALDSIVIVGLGASLGREAAPQQLGAAVASRLSDWAGLPIWQRRLLVASGAGAGMAAVYNVPLGGALFALEVLLGTVSLPLVLPALATSLIATGVAWVALPSQPTYLVPTYDARTSQIVWAVLAGPVAALASVAYIRLIAGAHALRPRGWMRVAAPIAVFAALGAVAIPYPEVLGNGKGVVQLALVGELALAVMAVLIVLKPVVTAACLASGAPGGLFTPTLTFGVVLGGVLGDGWLQLWPGPPLGSFAVIGGAAVLAAGMQAPLAAVVLLLELTHKVDGLMVPMLIAVVEATVISRLLRARSIYSARLPGSPPDAPDPSYGDIDASAGGDGSVVPSRGLPPG